MKKKYDGYNNFNADPKQTSNFDADPDPTLLFKGVSAANFRIF